ncbi:hypothetical protein F4694_002412 [Bacillus niacini]|uniref:Uncharacterized protein n=1 Tax=Neobacillus niacini TaxID=86668 RepID=A0A852TCE6_9BACI|nr:hypothetical protein [Neobacillus niacini]NYE05659.1 hypothetical protein [Neobacillus niacini]
MKKTFLIKRMPPLELKKNISLYAIRISLGLRIITLRMKCLSNSTPITQANTIMPESMDTYIAVGMFWVYPGMFPANIKVDPNSSNALPKLTIALEMIALSERNGN